MSINKTGDLNFIKFVGGNGPDTPTLYYLVRPELELAELAMVNGSFMAMKKAAAKLFAENEEITTAIKKGKLKGSDMQYILDEMAGGRKAEEPLKIIPEIKTDSVSNGVVGDDEWRPRKDCGTAYVSFLLSSRTRKER